MRWFKGQSQKQMLGMVVHICNPSTWEAESGGPQYEAILIYIARTCLKKRKKERERKEGRNNKERWGGPTGERGDPNSVYTYEKM
jgi:hypothetical protein